MKDIPVVKVCQKPCICAWDIHCKLCGELSVHWNTEYCRECYNNIKIFPINKIPKGIFANSNRIIWKDNKNISICMRKIK